MLRVSVKMVTGVNYYVELNDLEVLVERISNGHIQEVWRDASKSSSSYIVCDKISEFYVIR